MEKGILKRLAQLSFSIIPINNDNNGLESKIVTSGSYVQSGCERSITKDIPFIEKEV